MAARGTHARLGGARRRPVKAGTDRHPAAPSRGSPSTRGVRAHDLAVGMEILRASLGLGGESKEGLVAPSVKGEVPLPSDHAAHLAAADPLPSNHADRPLYTDRADRPLHTDDLTGPRVLGRGGHDSVSKLTGSVHELLLHQKVMMAQMHQAQQALLRSAVAASTAAPAPAPMKLKAGLPLFDGDKKQFLVWANSVKTLVAACGWSGTVAVVRITEALRGTIRTAVLSIRPLPSDADSMLSLIQAQLGISNDPHLATIQWLTMKQGAKETVVAFLRRFNAHREVVPTAARPKLRQQLLSLRKALRPDVLPGDIQTAWAESNGDIQQMIPWLLQLGYGDKVSSSTPKKPAEALPMGKPAPTFKGNCFNCGQTGHSFEVFPSVSRDWYPTSARG